MKKKFFFCKIALSKIHQNTSFLFLWCHFFITTFEKEEILTFFKTITIFANVSCSFTSTHTHSLSHTHTYTYTSPHTLSHSHIHFHTHTHTLTLTHTHTLTLTYTHTHKHTHTQTHTHTHFFTHISLSHFIQPGSLFFVWSPTYFISMLPNMMPFLQKSFQALSSVRYLFAL